MRLFGGQVRADDIALLTEEIVIADCFNLGIRVLGVNLLFHHSVERLRRVNVEINQVIMDYDFERKVVGSAFEPIF